MKLKVIFLGFFIALAAGIEIDLESFTPSPDSDLSLIDYGTVRVTKVKKNHFTISGDFELKKNIGNEKTIVFEIFTPNGNMLVQTKHPVCEYFKRDTLIWPDLVKASNLPNNNPCPFPKGNYTIKNFVVDDSKFKAFPIGKYHAKGKLTEGGKTLTHVDVVAWLKLG